MKNERGGQNFQGVEARSLDLPARLRASILKAAATDVAPTRPALQARAAIAMGIASIVSLGLFSMSGALNLGERPVGYLVTLGVLWSVVLVALWFVAFTRGTRSVGRPREWHYAAALGAPLSAFAIFGVCRLMWPEVENTGMDRHDLRCAVVGTLFAIPTVVGGLFAYRSTNHFQTTPAVAAVSAAAASFGALLIVLRCDCATWVHMVVGHLLPLVASITLFTLVSVCVLKIAHAKRDHSSITR